MPVIYNPALVSQNAILRDGGTLRPPYDGGETGAQRGGARPVYQSGMGRSQVYAPAVYPGSIGMHGGTYYLATQRVHFPSGNYMRAGAEVGFDGLTLPATTVVEAEMSKTIVKTELTGRKGSMKEQINTGDWQVQLRGVLTPGCLTDEYGGDGYPLDEVRAVAALAGTGGSLPVESDLFAALGIFQLVVEKVSFPHIEGFPNCQPFVLSCVSDEAWELEIRKDNGSYLPLNANDL